MIGSTISHYSVLEKVGEGGMGVVYKAHDNRLERLVALKFLPDEFAQDAALRERFLREARAASALNHPNICTVYDIGEEDGNIFIAMELLNGVTLKELVQQGPLQYQRLLDIGIEVTDGLAAAHSEGIIHRDIKLANIFVTRSGRVKILDFGLAKKSAAKRTSRVTAAAGSPEAMAEESQMTSGLAALGTAAYMSPEQAVGKALDERTDLFSFGIVLYEMATGRPPFRGDTTGMLFLSIVQETPEAPRELNPDLPDKLQRIIGKCLEKNRALRYQHASEIHADLQRLRHTSGTHEIEPVGPFDASAEAGIKQKSEKPSGSASPSDQQQSSPVAPAELPNPKPRRRLWKTLWAAAAIFIAFVAATVFHLHHKAHALPAHSGIVVADFTNTTGDPIFDGTLRQAVVVDLEQSPFVNVVSDRRVASVLKQMGKPVDERLSREIGREVCLRTNGKALIAGSIAQEADGYELQLDALNCATEQTIASVRAQALKPDEVLGALDRADAQLRRKMGESLPSVRKFDKPLAEATTTSLEALQAFSTAQSLRQQKGNTEALPYIQRAVQLDPNFAQAYAILGGMYANLGEPTLARENLERAFELRNRVSEAERYYIEAAYYDTVVGESDQLLQTCQEWIRSYPSDAVPHMRLASQYGLRGRYDEDARELREAIRLAPDSPTPYTNLILVYMELKRLDEAKATYAVARARKIDSENLELVRYDLAFIEGDTGTMHQLVESAKGKAGYQDRMALKWANTEAYFGRLGVARDFAKQAMAAAMTSAAKEAAGEHAAQHALTQAQAGNQALAHEFAAEALAMGRGRTVVEAAALAFAMAHDRAQSEELVEQLNRDYRASTIMQNYTLPTVRAAIEIDRKHPRKAVELLQAAQPYELAMASYADLHPAYVRGLAYLELKDGKKAANEFQKVIDDPGLVVDSIIGSLSYVQLARAEAIIGDDDAARTHYQDFLALWKDADPDNPIYKQAKAEYAKLK